MCVKLIKKLLYYLFGDESYSIAVREEIIINENKKGKNSRDFLQVIIVTNKDIYEKICEKNYEILKIIETLVKIQAYLNNLQVKIIIDK